ncbi:MAG: hypothetical protein KDC99_04505 [Cyclobacteriaceae bacterium]|nr:hypothetical protein [Cyclobacteriaceae bacterium]
MLSLLYSVIFWLHPLHVSVTEIEYNEKVNALQIISRIFIDDLETSIRAKVQKPELDLMNPKDGLTTKGLVNDYLKDHLKVRLDGKLQSISLLGFEEENFALICYIEIENVKDFKTIDVTNTVITETYDDQSNLVHVTYKGPIKSTRLMRDKPTDRFTFDN